MITVDGKRSQAITQVIRNYKFINVLNGRMMISFRFGDLHLIPQQ